MNQYRLYLAAGIIAFVLVVGFVLTVPRARDGQVPAQENTPEMIPPVTLRDVFKKGVHTISGSVMAPNACATVSVESSATADAIAVAVTLTPGEGVCLQVPTKNTFTLTVKAPAGLPITSTVNGVVATTTML